MVLQNYQNFIELTSNMIYIVALVVGLKCPQKVHLNTLCPPPTSLCRDRKDKNAEIDNLLVAVAPRFLDLPPPLLM